MAKVNIPGTTIVVIAKRTIDKQYCYFIHVSLELYHQTEVYFRQQCRGQF